MGEGQGHALIFTTKRALSMVHRSDIVASDPTYRLCPRLVGALQVLILAVFAFGNVSDRCFLACKQVSVNPRTTAKSV